MAPRTLEQLRKIADFVLAESRKGATASEIIAQMVSIYGAKHRLVAGAWSLSAAGVGASCTWSRDEGLLKTWYRNATVRIARERMK
jgi:hypothetical protein